MQMQPTTAVLVRAAALLADSRNLAHSKGSRNACHTELTGLAKLYGLDIRALVA